MSTFTQFGGGARQVTSITNTPAQQASFSGVAQLAAATSVVVGSFSVSVLKTGLSLTGRGKVNWLAVAEGNGAYSDRIKITVDGNVIKDMTTSMTGAGYGITAIGSGTSSFIAFQPITYESSFLVELSSNNVSSSQTVYYNAEVHA